MANQNVGQLTTILGSGVDQANDRFYIWDNSEAGAARSKAIIPSEMAAAISAALSGAVTGSGLTMATARLLGRTTASTGAIEEISIGSGLSLLAGVLSASGGSGKVDVLGTATASSSATITFDNVFDAATYAYYELVVIGVQPATDTVTMRLQLRDSTPSAIASTHRTGYSFSRIDSSGGGFATPTSSTAGWDFGATSCGNASNELSSFRVRIYPVSGQRTAMDFAGYFTLNATDSYVITGAGHLESSTAPAGLSFYFSSGNVSIGSFVLYGIRKS